MKKKSRRWWHCFEMLENLCNEQDREKSVRDVMTAPKHQTPKAHVMPKAPDDPPSLTPSHCFPLSQLLASFHQA